MTYKIIISGRVQGVGFRYFAQAQAMRYNIKGYVRNTQDNKVEIVCQGEPDDLNDFMSVVKKGPSFSHINKVDIEEEINGTVYDTFEIKY